MDILAELEEIIEIFEVILYSIILLLIPFVIVNAVRFKV